MRLDLGTIPPLGFTASELDRASHLRPDQAMLAALASDPASGMYIIAGEVVVLKKSGEERDPLFTPEEARSLVEPREMAFLGLVAGSARFALGIDPDAAQLLKQQRADLSLRDLRSIATHGLVAPVHLPPLAAAKALIAWHTSHRFCSRCGSATTVADAGWRRDCPSCRGEHFPRTDPVVIMLAAHGDRCLLGRQARFGKGMWSCLAGFVEPGESIEEAVRRETREEAGVLCGRVTYVVSQPWPFPMSLMIGCEAEALSAALTVDRSELEDARWFGREELAAMLLGRHPDGLTTPPPMAIAHHLIRGWVQRGATL